MAIAYSKALLDYILADMALATQTKPPETVDLGRVYDLHWIDPSLYDAESPTKAVEFERSRRFKHCGAAIAWARRQIFHGKVFGEHVEMRAIHRIAIGDKVDEHEDEVVDITLPGFCRWGEDATISWGVSKVKGLTLGRPERKCRAAQKR